jgi:hypothetical protein
VYISAKVVECVGIGLGKDEQVLVVMRFIDHILQNSTCQRSKRSRLTSPLAEPTTSDRESFGCQARARMLEPVL